MTATATLHDLGQSLWLDKITRDLVTGGRLKRYIDELSVTGLTSNPTIFDHAIKNSATYDAEIAGKARSATSAEELFFELALADLSGSCRLVPARLRANRRGRRLGLARGLAASRPRHRQYARRRAQPSSRGRQGQSLHQDPRHPGGIAGDRGGDLRRRSGQCDAALFSRAISRGRGSLSARRRAAHRGRAESGRRLGRLAFHQPLGCRRQRKGPGRARPIGSASRSLSAPTRLIANLLASPAFSAPPTPARRAQRLLWASTGTKDPKASDILYVKALAAPFTINTMPEATLKAFADHGEVGRGDGTGWRRLRGRAGAFAKAGIDVAALAAQLQDEGAASFVKSWNDLMALHRIRSARHAQSELSHGNRVRQRKHPQSGATQSSVPAPLRSVPPGRCSRSIIRRSKGVHLRQLFADDPRTRRATGRRGRRGLSRLFQEPDHRRDPEAAAAAGRGVGAARAHRRHVPRRQDQCLGEPRRAARRAARAARRHHPARRAERRARGPRRAGQDGGLSPSACAAATGRAIPASASATSSISASADRISGRSWPTKRSSTTATAP